MGHSTLLGPVEVVLTLIECNSTTFEEKRW